MICIGKTKCTSEKGLLTENVSIYVRSQFAPTNSSRALRSLPPPPIKDLRARGSYKGILVICDYLILFSGKREFKTFLFVIRDLTV